MGVFIYLNRSKQLISHNYQLSYFLFERPFLLLFVIKLSLYSRILLSLMADFCHLRGRALPNRGLFKVASIADLLYQIRRVYWGQGHPLEVYGQSGNENPLEFVYKNQVW